MPIMALMSNRKDYTLDSTTPKRTMVDVRKAILSRLKQLKRSRHWLAKQADMRTATLYDYLTGKGETSSDKVEKLLSILGLEIRPKD